LKTLKTLDTFEILSTLKAGSSLKYGHTKEMQRLFDILSPYLDFTEKEISTTVRAIIGSNVAFATKEFAEIANYEGGYNDMQFKLMKTYPSVSAAFLENKNFSKDVIQAVQQHSDDYSPKQTKPAQVVRFIRDFRKVLSMKDKFPTMKLALKDMERSCYSPKIVKAAKKAFSK
jgi:hypothetical protein